MVWSFWVNFVALRVLLFAGQEALMAGLSPGPIQPVWLVMGLALIFHAGVFIWQAVGVLRAAEAHVRGSGQLFSLWGAQLALVLAAFWVLTYSLEAWHLTQPDTNNVPSQAELRAERAARYSLTMSSDGRALVLDGSLELGVTARLKELLAAHPSVTEIRLTSVGGNIYEARGLAMTIRQHGLATMVETECSSACTTAFVGGATRRMATGARLGFHKYRVDADYAVLNANPKREENRDRETFRSSGVAPWFLEKMHRREATSMWYPELSELVYARVVTHIVDPKGDR